MKSEDLKQITTDIINNLNDQSKITELLTTLVDDNEMVNSKLTELTTSNDKYKEDNEKLRATNLNLFLKIGEKPKEEPTSSAPIVEEPQKPRNFEDLFNEKGGLK